MRYVDSSFITPPTIRVHGKFISRDGGKFLLKATRLPGVAGALDLSEKLALRRRLDELADANVNTLVLTEAQAESVLGVAGRAGLSALVELAIARQDLISPEAVRLAIARVAQTVSILRGYPGLIGFVIDCCDDDLALAPPALEGLRRGLAGLARTIHESRGNELIGLARRPRIPAIANDGHQLSQILSRAVGEDLTYVRLARIEPADFATAILAIHRLAGVRPLVIEFGEEWAAHAEVVGRAFGLGAAGVVAPAHQPSVPPGWQHVPMPSAGEPPPFANLNGSSIPLPKGTPMVSVVVVAHDDQRTIAACLESISQVHYPNYEVIVVDDGSRDLTAEIAAGVNGAGRIRVIRQRHGGIGAALNAGMRAARGPLIAITRADCVVDADWLGLAVRAIAEGRLDGCGGPIYPSAAVSGIAARAIASLTNMLTTDAPGMHATMLNDRNMVVRKASLIAAGGFDARFIDGAAAADLAARMVEAKMTLGWCPAGLVWCDARVGVAEYYRRRIADGRAAALLARKHPGGFSRDMRDHSIAETNRDRAAKLDGRAGRRRGTSGEAIAMRGLSALFSLSGAIAQTLARHHFTIATSSAPAAIADADSADRDSLHHLPIARSHVHSAHSATPR